MDRDRNQCAAEKARVIGIYGLLGSGKSTVLEALSRRLPNDHFQPYKRSKHIGSLVPGGLGAFQDL